jgi:hypothetical protein
MSRPRLRRSHRRAPLRRQNLQLHRLSQLRQKRPPHRISRVRLLQLYSLIRLRLHRLSPRRLSPRPHRRPQPLRAPRKRPQPSSSPLRQRLGSRRPRRLSWRQRKLPHPLRVSRKRLRRSYNLTRPLHRLSRRRLERRHQRPGLQTRRKAGKSPTLVFTPQVLAGCL